MFAEVQNSVENLQISMEDADLSEGCKTPFKASSDVCRPNYILIWLKMLL